MRDHRRTRHKSKGPLPREFGMAFAGVDGLHSNDMAQPAPAKFTNLEDCVEATLQRVGKHVVMGLPVAVGKPNALANEFVRRAVEDPTIELTIVTALSLRAPRWRSELERRLIEPLAKRVFGDYVELEYVRLIEEHRLPSNIHVLEFYLEPGAWLANEHLQQHYLSANYTHVAREGLRRGLNVLAQYVAAPSDSNAPPGVLSLGSNPDLTADLLPQIAAMRARGTPFALIGQIHPEMPFMYGDALLSAAYTLLARRSAAGSQPDSRGPVADERRLDHYLRGRRRAAPDRARRQSAASRPG